MYLATDSGALSPDAFGEESATWVALYRQYILDPVERLFHNSVLNTIGVILLWTAVGTAALIGLELLAGALRDARRASHDVNYTVERGTVRYSTLGSTLLFWLWRLLVGGATVAASIALLPFFQDLLGHNALLLQSGSLWELAVRAMVSLGLWMLIVHGYIVALRLFMLRTRVFGELLY